MSEWISTKDKKPSRAKVVLGYIPNGNVKFRLLYYVDWKQTKSKLKWFCDTGEIFTNKDVTHWMPLPKPPKE